MSDEKYQPIACSDYDIYEIAIMRHEKLDLHWLDDRGIEHHQEVTPVNLKISCAAEYLVVELRHGDKSSLSDIRLDKIIKAT
ncbi:MAG: hypothetical protein OEY61_01355 [Gammaproteobacteria bacterium]|nr:hypothetical protein [Gammaproteobacteria bacterium]